MAAEGRNSWIWQRRYYPSITKKLWGGIQEKNSFSSARYDVQNYHGTNKNNTTRACKKPRHELKNYGTQKKASHGTNKKAKSQEQN